MSASNRSFSPSKARSLMRVSRTKARSPSPHGLRHAGEHRTVAHVLGPVIRLPCPLGHVLQGPLIGGDPRAELREGFLRPVHREPPTKNAQQLGHLYRRVKASLVLLAGVRVRIVRRPARRPASSDPRSRLRFELSSSRANEATDRHRYRPFRIMWARMIGTRVLRFHRQVPATRARASAGPSLPNGGRWTDEKRTACPTTAGSGPATRSSAR